MSSPYPTPFEVYNRLPYRYPLIDFQETVRIPVAGPAPFNTLAIVRGRVPTQAYAPADDVLHRYQHTVATSFTLKDYDPSVPPPFQHSTVAALQLMEADDDTSFVVAIDEVVAGFFGYMGNWTLVFNVAAQWDNVDNASAAYFSSWVLCYEPPSDPKRPHGTRPEFENYGMPPNIFTVEREAAPASPADRQLERFLRHYRRRRARKLDPKT